MLEYQLQPLVTQISHYFRSRKKEYFLLVDTFDEAPFICVMLGLIQPLSLPLNNSIEEHTHEEFESLQEELLPLPDNIVDDENDSVSNLKHLLQVQLFDQILKPGMEVIII